MKKFLCTIFFFLILISQNRVLCQVEESILKGNTPNQKMIIKTNVTDLLAYRYSTGLEFKISQSFSLAIDVDRVNKKSLYLESNHLWYPFLEVDKKGMIIEPQIRFYPFSDGVYGFYTSLAGFFGWGLYHPSDGFLENRDWSAEGGSLHVGYQLIFGKIALDPFLGATLAKNNYPGPYYESTALFPAPNGLRFSGGLRLGVAF
jgi:hypothetical protein